MLNTNIPIGKLLPPIRQGGQVHYRCKLQNVIRASVIKIRNLLLFTRQEYNLGSQLPEKQTAS